MLTGKPKNRFFFSQQQRNRATSRAIPLAEAEKTVQKSIEAIVSDTEDITVQRGT